VTGQVLWEDQVDMGDAIDDIAWAVAIDGDQVFVAGTTNAIGARWNLILRAYHATTGALLWDIQHADVFPNAISARSGQVFVAGSRNSNTFMAAFNATNGGLIWEDTPTPGFFRDVQMKYQRVVGVGGARRGALVRVYHAPDGKVIWQDITPPALGFSAVALSDKAVYVTGVSDQDHLYSKFLVRAYDLFEGNVLFEDRSHRSGRYGYSEGSISLLGITHVYAVGRASDGGSEDFLIRAYDRKAIEPNESD
jgi:hypothetical protein